MGISIGETLPAANVIRMGESGPEQIDITSLLKGRNVVIFALPGAFTGTCTTAHLPSFMRTKPEFNKRGVDEIICLSVNDPFAMQAWGESTGALEAGITMIADSECEFSKAVGMTFSAPAVGLIDRSLRYALYAEDGVVKVLNAEENPGVCEVSAGEGLLENMPA